MEGGDQKAEGRQKHRSGRNEWDGGRPCSPPPEEGMGGGQEGVRRGSGGVQEEGKYRSSVDAGEPQNPTKSEYYQGHLQGVLYST
eukprot:1178585-Prorocentrum_minimum.AAC.8